MPPHSAISQRMAATLVSCAEFPKALALLVLLGFLFILFYPDENVQKRS